MSESGEYWHEVRIKEQLQKLKQLNWNTDVVNGLAFEYGFKLTVHNDFHFSLFDHNNIRMDYWPSTGKAMWFKKRQTNKTFHIPDIEAYLMKHFKPETK